MGGTEEGNSFSGSENGKESAEAQRKYCATLEGFYEKNWTSSIFLLVRYHHAFPEFLDSGVWWIVSGKWNIVRRVSDMYGHG